MKTVGNKFKVGQVYFVDMHMAKFEVTKVDKRSDHTWIEYNVIEGSIPGINMFLINSPFAALCKLSS